MHSGFLIDDTIRGIPPGTDGLPIGEVAQQGWHPASGVMSLPVLTIDEAGFAHTAAQMMRYAAEHGAAMAPHAKTLMAPSLAVRLIEAGAWGITVADIRQADVMLRAGLGQTLNSMSLRIPLRLSMRFPRSGPRLGCHPCAC